MAHLEANNILSPTQSDYRKHRSTEDQLALLAQEIENFFQEKNKKRLWQYSTTYPKLWREGLLFKVLQAGVSGRMYTWIRCILHDRSARVKVDGHLSDSVKIREDAPQGGVVSPTLFLVWRLQINQVKTQSTVFSLSTTKKSRSS